MRGSRLKLKNKNLFESVIAPKFKSVSEKDQLQKERGKKYFDNYKLDLIFARDIGDRPETKPKSEIWLMRSEQIVNNNSRRHCIETQFSK